MKFCRLCIVWVFTICVLRSPTSIPLKTVRPRTSGCRSGYPVFACWPTNGLWNKTRSKYLRSPNHEIFRVSKVSYYFFLPWRTLQSSLISSSSWCWQKKTKLWNRTALNSSSLVSPQWFRSELNTTHPLSPRVVYRLRWLNFIVPFFKSQVTIIIKKERQKQFQK